MKTDLKNNMQKYRVTKDGMGRFIIQRLYILNRYPKRSFLKRILFAEPAVIQKEQWLDCYVINEGHLVFDYRCVLHPYPNNITDFNMFYNSEEEALTMMNNIVRIEKEKEEGFLKENLREPITA